MNLFDRFYRLFLALGFLGFVFLSRPAAAGGLFYDSCVNTAAAESDAFLFLAADRGEFMGLTCDELRQYKGAAEAIQVALYPATVALMSAPARSMLAAELTSLGLTMANPAVLGVTVVGAVGVTTFYFIMKATLEECDQMDQARLKEAIAREIEQRYGLKTKNLPLEIRRK